MLAEIVERWARYKLMVKELSRFSFYLERFYISSRFVLNPSEVGLAPLCYLAYNTIKDEARDTVISLIDQDQSRERQIGDEKNSHLNKMEAARESLQLFKADLLDYSSIASAVAGCEGVFHVASPVPASKVADPEFELIAPALTGTQNVLRASSEAKVTRVIVVSSVAAVIVNPNWPKDRVMDEDCWSDIEYCRTSENWYCVSKTLAETEAVDYGKKYGLDVVTLCPSVVVGQLLQSTLNASSLFLINLLKGIDSIENQTWSFVDVRDVADALLLIYEKPEASGRYICAPHHFNISDIVNILKSKFPNYDYPKEYTEGQRTTPISSEKLKKLGWKCRAFEESVIDSVEYYQEAGLLKMN